MAREEWGGSTFCRRCVEQRSQPHRFGNIPLGRFRFRPSGVSEQPPFQARGSSQWVGTRYTLRRLHPFQALWRFRFMAFPFQAPSDVSSGASFHTGIAEHTFFYRVAPPTPKQLWPIGVCISPRHQATTAAWARPLGSAARRTCPQSAASGGGTRTPTRAAGRLTAATAPNPARRWRSQPQTS